MGRSQQFYQTSGCESSRFIAAADGLENRGVRVRAPVEYKSHFSLSSGPAVGHIQLRIEWVSRWKALFQGVKQAEAATSN
jgi:hypothetical protein